MSIFQCVIQKKLHTQCNVSFNILIALLRESEEEKKSWIKKKNPIKINWLADFCAMLMEGSYILQDWSY